MHRQKKGKRIEDDCRVVTVMEKKTRQMYMTPLICLYHLVPFLYHLAVDYRRFEYRYVLRAGWESA